MFFKGKADGGGQGRSIGNYRASLHAYGGALYSVTCSQRKDQYTRLCLLARSLAKGCFAAAVFVALSLVDSPPKPWTIPAHPLPGSTQAERICLPYAVVEMRLTVRRISADCQPAKTHRAMRFCRPAHYQKDDAFSSFLSFSSESLCKLPAYPGSPSCWAGLSASARRSRSA